MNIDLENKLKDILSDSTFPEPIKEMDAYYINKTNKNGSIYRGQIEKYKLVDTLTEFKVSNDTIINIKQFILKFVNEQDYIKKCKIKSRFLNRHLDEILLSIGSAKCVYDYLFSNKDWGTLQNNIKDFLLYFFSIDYHYTDIDGSIKIENIYDNIEVYEIEMFIEQLKSIISTYLIEVKYLKI